MMLGRVWQQVDLLLLGRLLFAFAFSTKFILVTRAVAAISNHTHLSPAPSTVTNMSSHTNTSHDTRTLSHISSLHSRSCVADGRLYDLSANCYTT